MTASGTANGPADSTAGPSVTDVSPASGPTAGGTTVTVTGSGFTGATAVSFGSDPGLDLSIASDTQLTVTAPPTATSGAVDVTVATPSGTSATGEADQFTYLAAGLMFLSWYRTGLGAAVQAPTGGPPLDTAPPAAATGTVTVNIGDPDNPGDTTPGNTAAPTMAVRLHAPGDVTGLDAAQVIRTYPTSGTASAPPDTFPLIEFAHPGVPWLLSPTGPQDNQPTDTDPRRGLTPWICLVVVPDDPPAALAPPATQGGLPTLTVLDSELPDVNAARLWGFTQWMTLATDNPGQDLADLISQNGQRALSRLLSPRYLQPNTPYLACVVPTFAPPNGAVTLSPAWQHSTPPATVTLPVYYSWQFTTGPAGDFGSLVKQLQRWDQGGVGIRPLDVGDAGAGMPAPAHGQNPWLINLEGALVSADVATGSWGPLSGPTQNQIQNALSARLGGTFSPPVPASGTAQSNDVGVPVEVEVSGGAVTEITVNGTTTGLTSGTVAVPVAGSIALTYTSAPMWSWTLAELTPPVYGSTQASFRGQVSTAAAPVVMGVGPTGGSLTGGNQVTVTGTGLAGATAVSFGVVAASGVLVANDTELTVTSPPAQEADTVNVTVTTPAGTSAPSSADQFTYLAAGQPPVVTGASPAGTSAPSSADQFTYLAAGQPPVVTGVSPASGWESGSTAVTVTGSGFTGATGVSFGQAAASGLSVASDTELTVTSPPAQEAGTVNVTVTTPAGTSAPSSADQFTYLAAGPEPVWIRTLNLDPRYRAAASLGASLVRANQDALILSAWDQAGQVRAANVVLRQGQLARETGQSSYDRRVGSAESAAQPMDDDRLLQVTNAVHAQIPAPSSLAGPDNPAQSVADVLASKPAVAAALSVPFRHLASPAGPLASRLTSAPLPPPVTSLDAGTITPTPPLSNVSGLVTLSSLKAPSDSTESSEAQIGGGPTLGGEYGGPVTEPGLWWEQHAAAGGPRLLQPGYLSDLWLVGSLVGRAMDWDGTVLDGWADAPVIPRSAEGDFTPGPAVAPGSAGDWYSWYGTGGGYVSGGGACLISWGPFERGPVEVFITGSAAVLAWARIETMDSPSSEYSVSVGCELRGDVIPSDPSNPNPYVPVQGDYGEWPTISIFPGMYAGENASPVIVAAAASAGDLTGTGYPSIAVAWSVNPGASFINSEGWSNYVSGPQVTVLFDVDINGSHVTGSGSVQNPVTAPVPASGDVQAVALANGQLYVLAGGDLWMAAVESNAGTIGTFTHQDWFIQNAPPEFTWATITAADFSGNGSADLLLFYAIPEPGDEGATAYRAAYQIGYEPDSSGDPTYWGEVLGADVPVTDVATSLVLGPVDQNTTAFVRQPAATAFRGAAAATQARMNAVIPPPASSSSPPPPVVADLAAAVRAAVNPQVAVPASVTQRLVLPAEPGTTVTDVLQPLAFTPYFPEPFFQTVCDSALSRLIPGMSFFPDEAITVLGADPEVVEAILLGANHELARELLWRGVPALHTGTFFARFWDRLDADGSPLPDIAGISGWDPASDLGSHTAGGDLSVLVWRGELVRRYPHATIYAAPAVTAGDGSRTIDLTTRYTPLFSGTLGSDSQFAGFGFTIQQAQSSTNSPGMYFVFQEHPAAPRFGISVPQAPASYGDPPDAWSSLDWSATVPDQAHYEALTYLDASPASPLWTVSRPDTSQPGATSHQWGFSAAHMAYITRQPPALVAIHADELLAPSRNGGTS
jgi:hypothetical protein